MILSSLRINTEGFSCFTGFSLIKALESIGAVKPDINGGCVSRLTYVLSAKKKIIFFVLEAVHLFTDI